MNPAYISAFSALAGAIIGGLTSFGTTWFTQRAQILNTDRQAQRSKLEALYNEFITEAARLFMDALTHTTEDLSGMVPLYALGSRMRLVSARPVIDAAIRIEDTILDTYLGPNLAVREMRDVIREGQMKNLLVEFSEACRAELPDQK